MEVCQNLCQYCYDSNIPDEELEKSEEISDDLSMAMFFVSHKLEFKKDYYIAWVVRMDEHLFFSNKEEIEEFIVQESIKDIPEKYFKWESMTYQELRSWHIYLSDRKLEHWEAWKGDDMSSHF